MADFVSRFLLHFHCQWEDQVERERERAGHSRHSRGYEVVNASNSRLRLRARLRQSSSLLILSLIILSVKCSITDWYSKTENKDPSWPRILHSQCLDTHRSVTVRLVIYPTHSRQVYHQIYELRPVSHPRRAQCWCNSHDKVNTQTLICSPTYNTTPHTSQYMLNHLHYLPIIAITNYLLCAQSKSTSVGWIYDWIKPRILDHLFNHLLHICLSHFHFSLITVIFTPWAETYMTYKWPCRGWYSCYFVLDPWSMSWVSQFTTLQLTFCLGTLMPGFGTSAMTHTVIIVLHIRFYLLHYT